MNNSGFTLIELVVTISLLAIMGVVIATNMVGLQNKQMAKEYESYKQKIADAACTYIESDQELLLYKEKVVQNSNLLESKRSCLEASACYVITKDLISTGFLDKDLKNPATGNYVTDNEFVKIYFEEGIKKCEYNS